MREVVRFGSRSPRGGKMDSADPGRDRTGRPLRQAAAGKQFQVAKARDATLNETPDGVLIKEQDGSTERGQNLPERPASVGR